MKRETHKSKPSKNGKKYRLTGTEEITKALELPPAIMANMAHIELSGNREAVVDGCKGVLEYDDGLIKLNTGGTSVSFLGNELTIRALTDEQAVIEGIILSIEFSS